jgi:hypothetical protein
LEAGDAYFCVLGSGLKSNLLRRWVWAFPQSFRMPSLQNTPLCDFFYSMVSESSASPKNAPALIVWYEYMTQSPKRVSVSSKRVPKSCLYPGDGRALSINNNESMLSPHNVASTVQKPQNAIYFWPQTGILARICFTAQIRLHAASEPY